MNKKIKLIIVSLILFVMVCINFSYAISIPGSSSFFEVNEEEATQGETIEMTMDLSQINYNQFEIVLNSNVEMENVYTNENVENKDDIVLQKENNDIVINIDKEQLNLNKIVLYYQIPENIEIGTKIQLNAQVQIENEVVEDKNINEPDNKTQENGTTIIDTKQIEITVVENSNKDKENNNNINQDEEKNTANKEQQGTQANETASSNQNNTQSTNAIQVASSTSGMQSASNSVKTSTTQTATYKGSNNNYLSSLEIDGVQLTADFNKEKSTYFATVEGLEEITVTATAEDSSSNVAITGTSLKSGENKVLISVTAKNGNVRYYRVYITNN
jgi:hypothetical protein